MWPCLSDDKCLSGNKVSSVISTQCPSPSVLSPQPSFPFKGWGAHLSSNHQPTNGIYLVVTGFGLIIPQHGRLGSCRDSLTFYHSSRDCILPDQEGPGDSLLESLGHSKVGVRAQGWYCCGNSLPLVDPALMSDILAWADPAQSGYQSSYCEE